MDQAPALHEWPWLKTSSKNLSGYPSPSRDWVTDSDTPQMTPLATSISILPYEPCYSRGMFTRVNTPALKGGACIYAPPQLGIPAKACRFGFIARHIQVSMEHIVTVLTGEQEPFVGTIRITGMSTSRAGLARVVGVYLDCHALMQEGFIGNHAMQFSKGPFGIGGIGLALLLRGLLAMLAFRSLSDVFQILQADKRMGVSSHDAFRDHMIGVLLQPSLSPGDHHQTAGSRASAFLLKTLSQSRIMVGFGNNLLSRVKRLLSAGGRCYCQVADTHIDPDNVRMRCGHRLFRLNLKTHQQVELPPGLVIPQLGCSDTSRLPHESDVLLISRVGNHHAPRERQDAHLAVFLQTVVPLVVVGERGGDILGRLIQALVALLGDASFALGCILLHLGPQRLVGRSDLARHIGCHLSRQAIPGT